MRIGRQPLAGRFALSNVNNVLAASNRRGGSRKNSWDKPAASIGRNKDSYGLDIAGICSKDGYIDFISPQIYFGFNNQAMPFSDVLAQWAKAVGEMKCIISVAAYKTGTVDKFAGSGSGEWQTSFDILARQYEAIESNNVCSASHYTGTVHCLRGREREQLRGGLSVKI